jgi:hypothetical protein
MPGDVCVQYLSSSIVESPGHQVYKHHHHHHHQKKKKFLRQHGHQAYNIIIIIIGAEISERERERGEKGELG